MRYTNILIQSLVFSLIFMSTIIYSQISTNVHRTQGIATPKSTCKFIYDIYHAKFCFTIYNGTKI